MPVIDFLKIIAVAAVIFIHTISAWRFSPFFTGQDGALLTVLDQAMRFSVPLFVALSGYGLMLGYGKKEFKFRDFFQRRLWRLLPWYLFFATVIILTVTFVWHENVTLYRDIKFWRLYLLGQADYHLYFVPMIIQLYFLFPFFLFLFRKLPPFLLVILAFSWQVFWYLLIGQKTEIIINNNGMWPDQEQYRSIFTWIFYFIFGMYLANKNTSKKQLIFGSAVIVFGFIFSAANSLNLLSLGMNIIVATRFTRLPVLIFATGVIILGHYLTRYFPKNSRFRWGEVSYIVYLLHTLVIRAVFHLPNFVSFGFGLISAAMIGTSFFLGSIIIRITRRQ